MGPRLVSRGAGARLAVSSWPLQWGHGSEPRRRNCTGSAEANGSLHGTRLVSREAYPGRDRRTVADFNGAAACGRGGGEYADAEADDSELQWGRGL